MPRYKLRTLLIVLAVLPPILAVVGPPLWQRFSRKHAIVPPVTNSVPAAPYFAIYPTGKADPVAAHNVISTLLAGTPGLRVSLDRQLGNLAVLGPPSAHKTIQAIIDGLQQGPPPDTLAEMNRFKAKLPPVTP